LEQNEKLLSLGNTSYKVVKEEAHVIVTKDGTIIPAECSSIHLAKKTKHVSLNLKIIILQQFPISPSKKAQQRYMCK